MVRKMLDMEDNFEILLNRVGNFEGGSLEMRAFESEINPFE